MKAYVSVCPLGVFGFDQNEKLVEYIIFPRDPKLVADRLLRVEKGKRIREEKELKNRLEAEGYEVKLDSRLAGKLLRKRLRAISKKLNFNLGELISKVNVEITRRKLKRSVRKEDLVIQAIGFIDELDKINNLLSERLREWYSLYFPELGYEVKDHQTFARLVSDFCQRNEFKKEKLASYVGKNSASKIEKSSRESVGGELDKSDLKTVRNLAILSQRFFKLRDKTVSYVKQLIKELAPNLDELAGPILTARLIELAGSLERLSKMPSSTIQVIGSEKSLFKHLRGKAPSPKFGVIYQHPAIHSVPRSKMGKVSRKLANTITIAAKADYFTGRFLADKLKKELKEEIKELRK